MIAIGGSSGTRSLEVTIVIVLGLVASGLSLYPAITVIESDVDLLTEVDPVTLRLPNETIPINYDIHLNTSIHTGQQNYDGQVNITIKCLEPTRNIVLHNYDLDILTVALTSASSSVNVNVTGFESIERTEFLNITLESALVVGEEYKLFIKYTNRGKSWRMGGWFGGSYRKDKDDEDNEVHFANTHFEPNYARWAFPCYDEPDKKATFRLEITHSDTYHALSNMPTSSIIDNGNGSATTSFQVTPRMSTYTLAFVVSDFGHNCKLDGKGREHCIYARPDRMPLTDWALDTGIKAFTALEEILGINYTLPKIGHVASPNFFVAHAMENWGLVIYHEDYSLVNESGDSRVEDKKRVGPVVVHELAHQWFGNLVTPKWWSNVWMSEGLSTLFQYIVLDKVYPEMGVMDQLKIDMATEVKDNDVWNDRAMTTYKEDIHLWDLTTDINYRKSAVVLRMVMLALGEETFMKGLRYYLQDKQYQNVLTDDLSEAIQRAVEESNGLPKGLSIKDIFDSWTLQGGLPLITATRDSPTKVTLTQRKYDNIDRNTSQTHFYIPITYTESVNASFESETAQDWFRGDSNQHEITINEESTWYLLNKNQSSYYRVNYDEKNWRNLASVLNDPEQFTQIPVMNRAQLIGDSLDLASRGHLNLSVAFEILKYLTHETDDIARKVAEHGLYSLRASLKLADLVQTLNSNVC